MTSQSLVPRVSWPVFVLSNQLLLDDLNLLETEFFLRAPRSIYDIHTSLWLTRIILFFIENVIRKPREFPT